MKPLISIIISAFNEEDYLPLTLKSISSAIKKLNIETKTNIEIIVVDNNSTDSTTKIAKLYGADVVKEVTRGISKARNTGAQHSKGDFLVFIDADTIVPESIFLRINQIISQENCIGGAISTDYHPQSNVIRIYLSVWRVLANFFHMAQGVTQFIRRDAFETIGGYDDTLYMSEDVDFYWRLRKLAKQRKKQVMYLTDIAVQPSCRRFNQWSILRSLVWTNPLSSRLLLHSKRFWHHWYDNPPR